MLRYYRRGRSFIAPEHEGDGHDDNEVGEQRRNAHPGDASDDLINFERQVNSAADEGEPFRPGPAKPEAVCFDEAKNGIHKPDDRYRPQARIRSL